MGLENKTVLVTGAAGDIGRAITRRFVNEGARVMQADLSESPMQQTVQDLGEASCDYCILDVTSEEQTIAAVARTVERFGGLDVFIANAGVEGQIGNIVDGDVAKLMQVLEVNVKGPWLGMKHAIAVMRDQGGGSIILTSSGAGVKGSPGTAPYNASKHAVIGLMRCAALECAPHNIRVNTVNPGPLEGRMMASIAEGYGPEASAQFAELVKQQTPLGRFGKAEEVAALMAFLASDDASYCTGGVYMVDGGNST